jgi:hypothetical protein
MRRGCIATGKVECSDCHRPIKYGERYLIIDGERDERQRFCMDCCLSGGYISYENEKGQQIVTFLPKE